MLQDSVFLLVNPRYTYVHSFKNERFQKLLGGSVPSKREDSVHEMRSLEAF